MPTANEIVFPAAILQEPTLYPPKKDEMGKPAINFGRAGSVIGHEISHSFDTSGRKFDQFGNLADWWTEKDASAFEARADSLKRQYNQYELYGVKGILENSQKSTETIQSQNLSLILWEI